MAGRHEPEAGRQHRFDADGAGRGLGERQALRLDVLRVVVGADHVDHAFVQRLDQSQPLVLAPQAAG